MGEFDRRLGLLVSEWTQTRPLAAGHDHGNGIGGRRGRCLGDEETHGHPVWLLVWAQPKQFAFPVQTATGTAEDDDSRARLHGRPIAAMSPISAGDLCRVFVHGDHAAQRIGLALALRRQRILNAVDALP
ncbi:MAG: hypothetical protein R3E87_10460 [Burkholderiaceae bacterium]